MNTKINFAGIEMKNPVTVASGTFGYGREFNQFFDLGKFAGYKLPNCVKKCAEAVKTPLLHILWVISWPKLFGFVFDFWTDEGIEEDVGKHSYYQPVAGDVADVESEHVVLDEGHDATTDNKHHEDAWCLLGIFAKTLNA